MIGCFGLTFKPNIDDLRESPSMKIAIAVTALNAGKTVCIEPNISLEKDLDGIVLGSAHDLTRAHIHVFLVDHGEFRKMEKPSGVIVDLRGVWA